MKGKILARPDITVDPPVIIDVCLCDLCGACVGICLDDCLSLKRELLEINGRICSRCGYCIPSCPLGALSWNVGDSEAGHSGGVANDA